MQHFFNPLQRLQLINQTKAPNRSYLSGALLLSMASIKLLLHKPYYFLFLIGHTATYGVCARLKVGCGHCYTTGLKMLWHLHLFLPEKQPYRHTGKIEMLSQFILQVIFVSWFYVIGIVAEKRKTGCKGWQLRNIFYF